MQGTHISDGCGGRADHGAWTSTASRGLPLRKAAGFWWEQNQRSILRLSYEELLDITHVIVHELIIGYPWVNICLPISWGNIIYSS